MIRDEIIFGQPGAGHACIDGRKGVSGNSAYFSAYVEKADIESAIDASTELSNNGLYEKKSVSYKENDMIITADGSICLIDSNKDIVKKEDVFKENVSGTILRYNIVSVSDEYINRYYTPISNDDKNEMEEYNKYNNKEKITSCKKITLTFGETDDVSDFFNVVIILSSGMKLKYIREKKYIDSQGNLVFVIPSYYYYGNISKIYVEFLNYEMKTIYATESQS